MKNNFPNIEGVTSWTAGAYTMGGNGGALQSTLSGSRRTSLSTGSGDVLITFNASRSNNIYGRSPIVQPETVRIFFIIKF